MSLPPVNFRGLEASVTMMELRAQPEEVMDRVSHGLIVHVTKNGKKVASIIPAFHISDVTVVRPDGSIEGHMPVTYGMLPRLLRGEDY